MRVGLVQLRADGIQAGDVGHYASYGVAAAAAGCDWLLFPELSDSGYDLAATHAATTQQLDALAGIAHLHGIWVFAGLRHRESPRDSNALQVFSPQGACVDVYRKVHLFKHGAVDETGLFTAGVRPVTIDAGGVQVGLHICFDLRFPALYRASALSGATVLVTAAAWPQDRIADWRLLQQARALENQSFTIGVNYCGGKGALQFGGGSLVCGPDGSILAEACAGEDDLLVCDVDINVCRQLRRRFPILDGAEDGL